MPYSLSRKGDLFTIRYWGEVDASDLRNANEELAEMIAGYGTFRALFDFARVSHWNFDTDELRSLAERWQRLFQNAGCERAAAIGEKDVVYGGLRMLSAFSSGFSFPREIFRDEGAAHRWLTREEASEEGGRT